jgi:hypothetical protein
MYKAASVACPLLHVRTGQEQLIMRIHCAIRKAALRRARSLEESAAGSSAGAATSDIVVYEHEAQHDHFPDIGRAMLVLSNTAAAEEIARISSASPVSLRPLGRRKGARG